MADRWRHRGGSGPRLPLHRGSPRLSERGFHQAGPGQFLPAHR